MSSQQDLNIRRDSRERNEEEVALAKACGNIVICPTKLLHIVATVKQAHEVSCRDVSSIGPRMPDAKVKVKHVQDIP